MGSQQLHSMSIILTALQWRHNGRDNVSNHRRRHCLLNCWLRHRSKKTSELRVTDICVGNSPVTGFHMMTSSCVSYNKANITDSLWGQPFSQPTGPVFWKGFSWEITIMCTGSRVINTSGTGMGLTSTHWGRDNVHVADIFQRIFLNENAWISIEISLMFVPKAPIINIPALVQIMAWRRPGDKPFSGPMMTSLLTRITRPQWVNTETATINTGIETEWPLLCRWHFQINFVEWNFFFFEICSWVLADIYINFYHHWLR